MDGKLDILMAISIKAFDDSRDDISESFTHDDRNMDCFQATLCKMTTQRDAKRGIYSMSISATNCPEIHDGQEDMFVLTSNLISNMGYREGPQLHFSHLRTGALSTQKMATTEWWLG